MAPRTVTGQVLHARRWGLLGWGVGIAALAGITVSFWPFVAEDPDQLEQLMQGLPEAMRALMGGADDPFSAAGFLDTQLFAFMAPLLFLLFAIGGAANSTAGEEQDGRLELLLANPVSRRRVMVSKAAGVGLPLAVLAAIHFATLAIASPVVGLHVGLAELAAMHVSLLLLACVFGALAFAVAGATGRRGETIAVSTTVAAAVYLLDSFAPIVAWLEPARPLSPFYLYRGAQPLRDGLDPLHAGMLAALTLLLIAVAVWAFDRRDIGTA